MFGLSTSASLYWLLTSALGAVTVARAAVRAESDPQYLLTVLLFAVAGAVAETFRVPMPTVRVGHRFEVSVSAAVYVAAVLIYPLHWAVLAVAFSFALAQVVTRSVAWYKMIFNVAQSGLSAFLAGTVWELIGRRPLQDPWAIPGVVAAVLTYFLANTWLVTAMVSLAAGLPVRPTWTRTYRHVLPTWLGMLFTGVLIAALWSQSPWTIALAAIPLSGLYYALRNAVTLETQTVESLFNLAEILDDRDPYTHGHSLRVGEYAQQLALQLGAGPDQAHLVFLAGRLHDIGKCAVDNAVLRKPGPLEPAEWEQMCQHAAVGGNMLGKFPLLQQVARYVRGHHERWDGAGYPDRLRKDEIPWGARVIAVADAYDAMTTDRPYRAGLGDVEAMRRLEESAGSQWDPEMVAAFLDLLREGRLERSRRLSAGAGLAGAAA